MTSTTVGIACAIPSERAAFVEWLAAAGYQPVSMRDLRALTTDLKQQPIEALVATADVVSQVGLPTVLKILTPNRPLVIVGQLDSCPPECRRRTSWLDRPTSAAALAIRVALALAEGRPVRRSTRKSVLYLPATVDGVVSQVVDVSDEGVRLQLKSSAASTLRPYFTLRIEAFGVAAVVQRAWFARPEALTVLCGGRIQQHLPRSRTWAHLVSLAPAAASTVTEI
jgi:hypothetical protein